MRSLKTKNLSLWTTLKKALNNVNAQDLLKQVEDPFKVPEAALDLDLEKRRPLYSLINQTQKR